jgi:hypothetical protein
MTQYYHGLAGTIRLIADGFSSYRMSSGLISVKISTCISG